MIKNKKNIEKSLKFFSWLGAFLITLILPYMYLLGLAYYQGYMSEFGVSSDMFPISTADVYVNAFVVISMVFFKCLNKINILIILNMSLIVGHLLIWGGVLSGVIYYIKFREKNMFFLNQSLNLKNKSELPEPSKNALSVINFIHISFQIILFVISLLLILWVGVNIATKIGESVAFENINKYLLNECKFDSKEKWNACIRIENGAGLKPQEGLFIAKNPDEIALFKKKGSYVYRLNYDSIIVKLRNQ